MPQNPQAVQWQIATDERMDKIVQRGAVLAIPELGHSVHVEVSGLQPARWYWYRFKVGNDYSEIGRTRTAPAFGTAVDQLRFGFVSCQHYANGLYYSHKHMAEDDLDFGVHLGDYIYEGASNSVLPGRTHAPTHEITTVEDYRIRYGQYKSEPNLRDIPVVMMTGLCGDEEMKTAAEFGANSYTLKPANAEQFLRTVLASTSYWLTIHQYPKAQLETEQCTR